MVAVFTETASGTVTARSERTKVIQLARDRRIEAVLVTELTRWGRSTTDLLHTLQELETYGVSLVAQTGLQFDLRSPQGKLFASLMSALAEFERDLLRERIRSGIAAAQERGVKFGRQKGQRVKADRYETRVMALKREGKSYRAIAAELHLSKNTVMDISHRVNDRKTRLGKGQAHYWSAFLRVMETPRRIWRRTACIVSGDLGPTQNLWTNPAPRLGVAPAHWLESPRTPRCPSPASVAGRSGTPEWLLQLSAVSIDVTAGPDRTS